MVDEEGRDTTLAGDPGSAGEIPAPGRKSISQRIAVHHVRIAFALVFGVLLLVDIAGFGAASLMKAPTPVHLAVTSISDKTRVVATSDDQTAGFGLQTNTSDIVLFGEGSGVRMTVKVCPNICAALEARFSGSCATGFTASSVI